MHTLTLEPNPKPSATWKTRLLWGLGLLVLWSLPAIPTLFHLHGNLNPFQWEGALYLPKRFQTVLGLELLNWYIWIPMSIWVARLGIRFPLLQGGTIRGRNFGLHLVFGFLVGQFCNIYHTAVFVAVYGNDSLSLLWRREGALRNFVLDSRQASIYWLVLLATFGWQVYQESQRRKLHLTQARLATLKSQIHPHFLFNTLHSISALMEDDVAAARTTIARLSDVLRVSLDEPPGDEVPLEDEIHLARLYLEIEHVRFSDRLDVQFEIDPESREARVPHLLLQPLVENAVTHGIGGRSDASLVRVASRIEGEQLILEIDDDGPGLSDGTMKDGIGLGNTRARLEQLYSKAASVDLAPRPGGGARCTVRLPFRPSTETR